MKKISCILFFVIFLITVPVAVCAEFTIPPRPTAFVNDYAKLLSPDQLTRIEQICKNIEQQLDGIEFAVVTVPSLNDLTIEDATVRWFEAWKIGKKDKNNGLLLMVAPKERKVKIEVGYGLEPILPDGVIGELLDRGFVNTFRLTQNYGDAINNTVSMIGMRVAKIEGKKLDGVQLQAAKRPSNSNRFPYWWLIFAVIFFFLRRRTGFFFFPGGFGGGGFGGGGFGGGGFGGFGGGESGGGGASRSF